MPAEQQPEQRRLAGPGRAHDRHVLTRGHLEIDAKRAPVVLVQHEDRALGHRSILADPRTESSRDLINREIKKREMWRPLAPSILASAAPQVVEYPVSSDFMIEAFRATPWACENLSGVVHVDGTMRAQFVDGVADPLYADLLASLEREIGIGAVLNTSFNGEDEPIVNNTLHALSAFFSAPIDALVIGPFVVRK